MRSGSGSEFDFEHWAALARRDPEAFERARENALAALIERAPDSAKRRLRGIQWQVDTTRSRAGTPLAACMQISRLMWERVAGPGGLLERLEQLEGGAPASWHPRGAAPADTRTGEPARVLPFPPPRGSGEE